MVLEITNKLRKVQTAILTTTPVRNSIKGSNIFLHLECINYNCKYFGLSQVRKISPELYVLRGVSGS